MAFFNRKRIFESARVAIHSKTIAAPGRNPQVAICRQVNAMLTSLHPCEIIRSSWNTSKRNQPEGGI
jgi:hypothetical protein